MDDWPSVGVGEDDEGSFFRGGGMVNVRKERVFQASLRLHDGCYQDVIARKSGLRLVSGR